jgi:hypothetical protein
MATYAAVCRECGEKVLTAPMIGDGEATQLHQHLRLQHPDLLSRYFVPALGALLRYFEVRPDT